MIGSGCQSVSAGLPESGVQFDTVRQPANACDGRERARLSDRLRIQRAYRRSYSRLTLGFDSTAVRLHHVPHDSEAESAAPRLPCAPAVDPVEAFENSWQMMRLDPLSDVAHAEPDAFG